MPEPFNIDNPDHVAALGKGAPHLHVMATDEALRLALRKIEEQEAIVIAKGDLATRAAIDAAERPLDFEKFTHSLLVAREEVAASIELETQRLAYISSVLTKTKEAMQRASLVPA